MNTDNTDNSNLSISGLFEIHITVDDTHNHKFRLYCLDKKLKPIYAISEICKPQLMLSKYKNSQCIQDVIDKANDIAKDLENMGISVTRVKVESMGSNVGVPKCLNDIPRNKSHYFEWHIKYQVYSIKEYDCLKNTVMSFEFDKNDAMVFMSFNSLKKEINPIVTLRVSGHIGSVLATGYKDNLIDFIKKHDIHTNDGIQYEFAVYDTNVEMDNE
jgi:hypothetical protein